MTSISKKLRERVLNGCEGKAFYLEVDKVSGRTTREICLVAHVLSQGSGAGSDCKVEGTIYHAGGKRKPECPGLVSMNAIRPDVIEDHRNHIPVQSDRINRIAIPFSEVQSEQWL